MGIFDRILFAVLGLGVQNIDGDDILPHLDGRPRRPFHLFCQQGPIRGGNTRNANLLHFAVRQAFQSLLRTRLHQTLRKFLRIRPASQPLSVFDSLQLPVQLLVGRPHRPHPPRLQRLRPHLGQDVPRLSENVEEGPGIDLRARVHRMDGLQDRPVQLHLHRPRSELSLQWPAQLRWILVISDAVSELPDGLHDGHARSSPHLLDLLHRIKLRIGQGLQQSATLLRLILI